VETNKLIGLGEVEPVDKRFARCSAQAGFLQLIKEDEKASDVLRHLACDPYRYFVEARANPAQLWPIRDYQIRYYGRPLYMLRWSLLTWAQTWHLEADWIFETVCWTLDMWRQLPDTRETFELMFNSTSWTRLNDQDLKDVFPPTGLRAWTPDTEFRSSYERYAKNEIEAHIRQDPFFSNLKVSLKIDIIDAIMAQVNSYCERVLEIYLSQKDSDGNFVWKLAERREDFERNLKWTIKFQVLGESFSKIAQEEDKAVSTVKRAIEDALELLNLPKRKDAGPGRRRGSKEAKDSRRRSFKQAEISD
jgi:hypothetical protein